MNPSLLSVLQDQFLNKKITVVVQERDNNGRTIPNKFTTCSGCCTFIGSNNVRPLPDHRVFIYCMGVIKVRCCTSLPN